MSLRIAVITCALIASAACSSPSEAPVPVPAERFVGTWQSTTAPYEHLRLTVNPRLPEHDWLGVRLTFSGTAWEGPGRIEADSLILDATTSSMYGAAVIAHPAEGGALSVRVMSAAAQPLMLTFVRGQ